MRVFWYGWAKIFIRALSYYETWLNALTDAPNPNASDGVTDLESAYVRNKQVMYKNPPFHRDARLIELRNNFKQANELFSE